MPAVLDSGAVTTHLWSPFADEFAGVVKASGKKDSERITGVGGSAQIESLRMPELTLRLGGRNTRLAPAYVLLEPTTSHSQIYYANVGLDLLSQGRAVTIDFRAMTLALE